MIDSIDVLKCTGCKMCADLCPKEAISFETNEQGFWYPKVDNSKCVQCGACIKKCIVNKEIHCKTAQKAFAAWSKDDQIRRESTSGGVYYELASAILEKGGFLVGSVYTSDYCKAFHIISNQKNDLNRIMGSKYFQSDTAGIYKKTKEILDLGNLVLFTGTPCQVHALKEFLGKEYPNLITVDFICRGVPSPLLQQKKIELYEQKWKSKVKTYRDKSKYVGWANFGEYITFENGRKVFISRWEDHINNCFIEKSLNTRESCYLCKFKGGNNASDLTMGDFWGISKITNKDSVYGVSALIANTNKGIEMIRSVRNRLYVDRMDVKDVGVGNPAYVDATARPEKRDYFFDLIKNKGLDKAVKMMTKNSLKRRIKTALLKLKPKLMRYKFFIRNFYQIKIFSFIKYNYFSKNIERDKGCFLYPMKGALINIKKTSKIKLNGNLIINNYPSYRRGNYQARLKMGHNAHLWVKDDVNIAYGNILSIAPNAEFISGRLLTGVNANIICAYKMTFGNRVMLGRNVCVFDSDYHPVYNDEFEKINSDREVIIGDNCWIGANSMVLKGSRIDHDAIVSANSMVMGNVESGKVYINKRDAKSVGEEVIWKI